MKKNKIVYSMRIAVLVVMSIIALGYELPIKASATTLFEKSNLQDIVAGAVSVEDVYGKLDKATVPSIIDYEYAVSRTLSLKNGGYKT